MHYVIGDIHSSYNELMILLNKLNLTKEDVVYFVGDFLDRAKNVDQELKTAKWFLENITDDGPFQAVIGNHDLDLYYDYESILERYNDPVLTPFYTRVENNDLLEVKGVIKDKFIELPLYKEVTINGIKNIITHSWLCNDEESVIDDFGNIGDANIRHSVWDRLLSIVEEPENYRLIHGHTPTTSRRINIDKRSLQAKIIHFGKNNIDVDCGCFLGLANGGNLAAICLETDEEFYAYTQEDRIQECKELAELTDGLLKDWQIYLACSNLGVVTFIKDMSDFTEYAKKRLAVEYKLDVSDRDKSNFLHNYMRLEKEWKEKLNKCRHIDSRFQYCG